ncbi:MAG: beta-galactosidase [Planctomycetota bacterium]
MSTIQTSPRALVIDGRKELIVAGCIHYWRSTPQMWPELLRRSKEAGINTIQTYVYWGGHEPEKGKLNFSGRYDLSSFCQAVEDAGMHLIVRLGPYICAEANYGGFPQWLRDIPDVEFRTWNEPFMREMEDWIRKLGKRLDPFSPENGGPLILAEIENEYDQLFSIYGKEGRRYIEWALELGKSLGLGVPWLTCGSVEGALPTIHGFEAVSNLKEFREKYPDVPPLWTEHWPGWGNTFGSVNRLRSPEAVAYETARFFAQGGAGLSYYMWHAGTNFENDGMFLQSPDYGFEAPLDEYGRTSTKGRHLGTFHRALLEKQDVFLDNPPCRQKLEEGVDAWSYGSMEDGLHFLENDDSDEKQVEWCGETMMLRGESTVLMTEEDGVLFDSGRIPSGDRISRSYVSMVSLEEEFDSCTEGNPSQTRDPVAVTETPEEQLQWTRDLTDYCWYVTDIDIEDGGPGVLTLTRAADLAYIFIDGELIANTTPPVTEGRGDPQSLAFAQQFDVSLWGGRHELAILCCGVGLVKHDCKLHWKNLSEERKGLWGPVLWKGDPVGNRWRVYPGLDGESMGWLNGHEIPSGTDNTGQGFPTWWRATFKHPGGDGPFAIDLSGMKKGLVWVNEFCLGRYWQVPGVANLANEFVVKNTEAGPAGEPTQRYYHVPAEVLEEENTLVLLEEQGASADRAGVSVVNVNYETA